jgi:TonB family protein
VCLIAAGVLLLGRPRRPAAPVPAASELAGTVTAELADLKSEPSERSSPAGTLGKGTRVSIVGGRGRWLEIRAGQRGAAFIGSDAVETDAERQARSERARKILAFKPVSGLIAEDTDLLLGPYPSAPRSGRLRRGSTVPVYAVDHDYYAVRGEDRGIAFVHSADVDLVPPDPRLPAIVPQAGRTIKDVAINDLSPAGPAPAEATSLSASAIPSGAQGEAPALEEPIEPAVLISKVDPSYPEAARRAGVDGTVVLDAEIDQTGQVVSVTVKRGLPLGVSEAAVAAVERWKYRPARGRTGPVPSHKTIRIQFTLGN